MFDVPPDKLQEVAGERVIWASGLMLLPSQPDKNGQREVKAYSFPFSILFSLRAFFIVILSISRVMIPCKTVNDDQKAKLSIIMQKYLKTHFSVKHSCRQFTHRVVHTHR